MGHFYPYGQEKPSATQNGTEKFTGYLRDAETGMDYAVNRYHVPGTGRFLTPDPYMGSANSINPGSWNRYSYATGDSIILVDPSGLADCPGGVWWSDVNGGSVCVYDTDPADNPQQNPLTAPDGTYAPSTYTSSDITGYDADGNPIIGGNPDSATGVTVTDSYDPGTPVLGTVWSPITGGPNSWFIIPGGMGPKIRIIGPRGCATCDIHYQPNHPEVGNPHLHRWTGERPGPPEAIPPGSRIPVQPEVPPDTGGPYSLYPRQPSPVIAPVDPIVSPTIPIMINPCVLPGFRSMLPMCNGSVLN